MAEKPYDESDVVVPECLETAIFINKSGGMTIFQQDPYSTDECFVVIPKEFVKHFSKKVAEVSKIISSGGK